MNAAMPQNQECVPDVPLAPVFSVAITVLVQRRGLIDVHVVGDGQRDLLEVVDALRAARGLARRLDGRQEERDQDGDDRDHDQKLDQCEAASLIQVHGS